MNKVLAVLVTVMINAPALCVDKRIVDGAFAVGRAFFPAILMGGFNWKQQQKAALAQQRLAARASFNRGLRNVGQIPPYDSSVYQPTPDNPSTR